MISNEEQPAKPDVGLTPEGLVGGVWVTSEQAFVQVHPVEPVEIEWGGNTFTIQEYADEKGDIRASLLDIPAGNMTPAWYMKQPNSGYLEVHQVVSGNGTMVIKPRDGDHTRSGSYTDSEGRQKFDVRSGMHSLEAGQVPNITIQPGETFQVLADSGEQLQVLATFPKEPFDLEFETRVGSLL